MTTLVAYPIKDNDNSWSVVIREKDIGLEDVSKSFVGVLDVPNEKYAKKIAEAISGIRI